MKNSLVNKKKFEEIKIKLEQQQLLAQPLERLKLQKQLEYDWVKKFLERDDIKLNEDGSIDVEGDVYLSLDKYMFERIPLQFNYVGGYFSCGSNQLKSLEGAPVIVGGGFDCEYNQLQSLEGAPRKVGGYFVCNNNRLKSLKYTPRKVYGVFDCSRNQLKSLKYAPEEVVGCFGCWDNNVKFTEEAVRYVSEVEDDIYVKITI